VKNLSTQNVGLRSDWGPVLDVHHKYHVNVTVGVPIISDRFYRAIRLLTVDGVVAVSVTEGSFTTEKSSGS